MSDVERFKTLDDSEVDYYAGNGRGARFESTSSSSARGHKKRWSPYARKRKLFPKKSFSLESIPRAHAERLPSFELTQSMKDHLSSIDLESVVPEKTQITAGWLSSTGEDPDESQEKHCSACEDTSEISESFLSKVESETTIDCGNYCSTILTISSAQPPTECSQPAKSENRKGSKEDTVVAGTEQPITDWLLWCAYAKLMKLAWIKTRQNLSDQTHRAENCELQARSTMTQVISMKTQLKSDISDMRERVQKIHSIRVILESTQEDRRRLQITNETIKSKIHCLNDEKNNLSDTITACNATLEGTCEKGKLLKSQLTICTDELKELKQEKMVLDSKIQELSSLSDEVKEKIAIERRNIYNRELEMAAIQKELAVSTEKIKIEARMMESVREQSVVIRQDLETATEVEKNLQEQLTETREKVSSRDLLIAELRAKVESAAEQIAVLKKAGDEKKSLWRRFRFRFLPKDSRSLFSIQL